MACWILMDDHEADGGSITDVGSREKGWPSPAPKLVLTWEQTGKTHG